MLALAGCSNSTATDANNEAARKSAQHSAAASRAAATELKEKASQAPYKSRDKEMQNLYEDQYLAAAKTESALEGLPDVYLVSTGYMICDEIAKAEADGMKSMVRLAWQVSDSNAAMFRNADRYLC
jgi:hypothetical protein